MVVASALSKQKSEAPVSNTKVGADKAVNVYVAEAVQPPPSSTNIVYAPLASVKPVKFGFVLGPTVLPLGLVSVYLKLPHPPEAFPLTAPLLLFWQLISVQIGAMAKAVAGSAIFKVAVSTQLVSSSVTVIV